MDGQTLKSYLTKVVFYSGQAVGKVANEFKKGFDNGMKEGINNGQPRKYTDFTTNSTMGKKSATTNKSKTKKV